MKKLKLLFIIGLSILPLQVKAEGDDSSGGATTNPPVNLDTRPMAPARKLVAFEVKDGFMTVKFRSPQGKAEMEVLNLESGMTEHYEFDSDAPFTCFVGASSLGYDITILTETGYTIKGTL